MPVATAQFPVNLVLDGRAVLVVGAGVVAARKIEGLIACGARVTVVATAVGAEVRALVAAGLLAACHERPYVAADLDGMWLATTATDQPSVNAQVRADGDARRLWVNAADDPTSCSFTLPAVVRQGPLLITVATGGHSPALATWLRRRIQAELGPEYIVLVEMLSAARDEIKAVGGSTEGLDWLGAIDSGMLELIREGRIVVARERLRACLSSS